jgi:hypothetical protein
MTQQIIGGKFIADFPDVTTGAHKPAVGYKLYTYISGSTTNQATYSDAGLTTPNTNPVVLDARGEASVFMTPGLTYTFVLKTAAGTTIWTRDGIISPVSPADISGSTGAGMLGFLYAAGYGAGTIGKWLQDLALSTGSSFIGFIQSGVGAVLRTMQDRLRDRISVKDFGVVGDGSDETIKIQAAATAAVGKALFFPKPLTEYFITAAITLLDNTEVYGEGGNSIIRLGVGDISGFYANAKSGVVVRDLRIKNTVVGSAAYIAGVKYLGCTDCRALRLIIDGMTWTGVLLENSSDCEVSGCKITGALGTVGDSADITVFRNSNDNLIQGNWCYGGAIHGIFLQSPYDLSTPTGNTISKNRIKNQQGDGISVYATFAYDTQTLIDGNRIDNILGTALAGLSGHGIYVQSMGGTIVSNNRISNCCLNTTNFDTQVVGAIGVAVGEYGTGELTPVTIIGNRIKSTRGPAINAATSNVAVLIIGNNINSTGVAAVRGESIRVINVVNAKVSNNSIIHANTNYAALTVIASDKAVDGVDVSNNNIKTVAYGTQVTSTGTGSFTNVNYSGNKISGGNDQGISFTGVTGLSLSANNVATSGIAAVFNNCPVTRMSTSIFTSAYTPYSMIFTGTMTGSIVDETNKVTARIENDGGTIISQYGNASGAAGNIWAVGDRVIQSIPVVGSPKGWRCTVAGAPGTWVSEGNL